MLELGRVDFEVTLTLCRWEWGSCAPLHVTSLLAPAQTAAAPLPVLSPLLSFSTTALRTAPPAQKTCVSPTVLQPEDHVFALCGRTQKFARLVLFCPKKCKEVTLQKKEKKRNIYIYIFIFIFLNRIFPSGKQSGKEKDFIVSIFLYIQCTFYLN